MLRAVLAKELHKAGRWLAVLLAANALAATGLWLRTRTLFHREHAEIVWYQVMQLGHPFCDMLRHLPLATGAGLALAQFLPEMRDERLRLSLHLPADSSLLILAHLAAGLAGLAACLAVQAAGIALTVRAWFPAEMTGHALALWTPRALAGAAGYLGMALVLLEPSFLRRLTNVCIAAAAAGLFLLPPQGGIPLSLWSAASLPLLALAVLHPVGRYRNRKVD